MTLSAPTPVTRRAFLKTAALAAAAPALPVLADSTPTREPLQPFPYAAVTLTAGPFKEHYDAIHAHYLSLSNDRLLKPYRQRAGLPAPGKDMGGWYDTDGFVPGSTLGQYISGLARIGAATGDPACHEKVQALVAGFAATLGPENQSILRPKTNLWTCYTLDKHFAGLIDSATLSNLPEATDLLNRVLAGSQALLPAMGRDRIGKKDPPYDETFIMPENLFTAADLTHNPAFAERAHRYLLDRELFDPLAAGRDPFPGQHAYSHAIALSSAAKAYQVTGDTKYKSAMRNAHTLLTTTQQFASGGWGPNETFITPGRGELYASLSSTVDHFETPCGSYAATKLARYLLRFTADPQYGDNLERVLFNTILATRFPDSDGDYPYYSTYSPSATKVYYQKKWPCCSGTLVQTVADYPQNIFFQGQKGIYVNLYTPSELRINPTTTLIQTTEFPAADTIHLRIESPHPIEQTLYLRIPAWAAGIATLTLNDKPYPATPTGFFPIQRTWHSTDVLTLTLPQSFRTESIDPQHPNTAALMRGPVEYVALNPTGAPTNITHPVAVFPTLNRDLKPIAPQSYTSADRIVVPLHTIQSETYDTYFNL